MVLKMDSFISKYQYNVNKFTNIFNKFHKQNSLKDTDFNRTKQEQILNYTYEKIENDFNRQDIIDPLANHQCTLLDVDNINNTLSILVILDRNHLKKDKEDNFYYSFIYEIFTNQLKLQKKIDEYKVDVKCFKHLQKKYKDIKAVEELQTVIDFYSIVKRNNVNHFLFEIIKELFEDNKRKKLEKLFGILFYYNENTKSLTNNKLTDNEFDNIDALFLADFFDSVYF
jgi:hypothetical protein